MNLPQTNRPPLEGKTFHVIVIGGGINGAAIARECARAGRRVLLLEQDDFGAGTSSRSSLRERQRLLRVRPNLVRTRDFLLALGKHSRRSALQVRLGLWLYRRLGGRSAGASEQKMERARFERLLDSGQRWSIFSFEDAQCEFPERLVAEWMGEAAAAGALVRNHSRVLAIDLAGARAMGVLVRDLLSGKDERVKAGWIVNASGPWADRLCQRSGIKTPAPCCPSFVGRRKLQYSPRRWTAVPSSSFHGTDSCWWAPPRFRTAVIRERAGLRRKKSIIS